MILRWITNLVVCVLVCFFATAAYSDPPEILKASVNRGIFVQTTPGPESLGDVGCTPWLTRLDNLAVETPYPCAQWFVPPGGEYLLWVESKGRITRSTNVVLVPEVVLPSDKKLSVTLVPAGSLALGRNVAWPKGGTLRVVGAGSGPTSFERRIYDRTKATTGIQMPTGLVLPGLFDAEGNALALSRPITIQSMETSVIDPRPPATGGDLLAIFDGNGKRDLRKASVVLEGLEERRLPDAVSATSSRVIAVWYGLPPGERRLTISDGTKPISIAIQPRAGRVVTIRKALATDIAAK
jgi:hypothetical protein